MAKRKLVNIRRRGDSWQVDSGTRRGRRIQKSFKTRSEAEEWARLTQIALANNRFAGLDLSEAHRIDASKAYQILAVQLNVPISSLPSARISLESCVQFFLEHAKPVGEQRTVRELLDEYLTAKTASGRRPITIRDLRHRIGRLVNKFGDTPVHLITTRDLDLLLDELKCAGITRKNYRTHFIMFFNFARKRKYATENPALDLEIPVADERLPTVLSLEDCRRLMRSAEEHGSEMVPYFAIALFAGLRPTEVERLKWEYIDLEQRIIKVTPEMAKKRRMRLVTISDNLYEWLLPWRNSEGFVYSSRKAFEMVRRKSGIEWSHDVLRHTYASNHLAMGENAAVTSLQLGHRDQDVLFNHYRNLVRKSDAERFWTILPSRVIQAKVIKFPA